jgi:AraC family transcriptional regulator
MTPGEPAVARALDTGAFAFREVVYPDRYAMPAHEHDIDCLVLVAGGALTGTVGNERFEAREAALLFMPAWRPHANTSFGDVRTFDVVLSPRASDEYRDFLPRAAQPVVSNSGAAAALAARMHRELQHHDRATPLILAGLTLELLAVLSRASLDVARRPRWIAAAIDFLHAHIDEAVSLGDAAAAAGVHPAHLTRAFRTHVGCTVGEYSRRLRLDRACAAIAKGRKPLAEIALDAGFSDQSHFSRAFRAYTGMTPGQYRMQLPSNAMQLDG